ncbi:CBS domain-containing protein [Rhizobium metallidurans]|uniref:CBS domain-containing protein n=1 Tax=Rhizobium metallidurans TaxID=1265931 RepID=A0A7W6CWQ0_9HYPH|nr:CBS domain-containing protein [Rhizobium metallidurans]MBB3965869.1 CBS domain-containing protein [Rhizobium metallidurans]
MTVDPITVSPDHSVWHAAHIMLSQRVSGLPVLDSDLSLVGIVTEGDLLRRTELGNAAIVAGVDAPPDPAMFYLKSRSWRVGDVMSTKVVMVEEDTPIGTAAMLLGVHRIKRLPVQRDGRLVGIVSRADLLSIVSAGKPDAEVRGDEAVRRALAARLQEAASVLTRQPGYYVEAGAVRVVGVMASASEIDVVRMIVESVAGPGFKDELKL